MRNSGGVEDNVLRVFSLLTFIIAVAISASLPIHAAEEDVDATISWLKKYDFANRENRHVAPKPKLDMDGWFAEGKAIPNVATTLDKLLETQDKRVDLAEVAFCIGHIGNKDSVPTLLGCVSSKNLGLRIESVVALGALGDERAVDKLISLLSNDTDKNIRANAASSLGRIGGEKGDAALSAAIDDQDAFVASVASHSLERLRANALKK